jgi:diguanylate cyclase (GGDEF)-like protein
MSQPVIPLDDAGGAQELFAAFGRMLDMVDTAFCVFDAADRAVAWNDRFLAFFPEHAGHVHVGEPYAENLRRFYECRLSPQEKAHLARYVREGIARHRAQFRPFAFAHRGRLLQVAAQSLPGGYRARVWRALESEAGGEAAPGEALISLDLLNSIADGAMAIDASGRILAANEEFRVLYDVPAQLSVVGLTLPEVVHLAWRNAGLPDPGIDAAVLDNLRFVGAPFEVELPGGRWRRVMARHSPQGATYFTHVDISPLRRQVSEMSSRAATDALTDLPNRRHFEEVLAARWTTPGDAPLSLLLIDLDHFKEVNDTLGHLMGDECLRRAARLIGRAAGEGAGIAARFGGDEFAVLLPGAGQQAALVVAGEICRTVAAEPWEALHPAIPGLTASIGIGTAGARGGRTTLDLLNEADLALYRAKREGRNRAVAALLEPL